MRYILRFLFWLGKARWIVDDDNDPGIRIFGINIVYHKWNDTFIIDDCHYRLADKREITTTGKILS